MAFDQTCWQFLGLFPSAGQEEWDCPVRAEYSSLILSAGGVAVPVLHVWHLKSQHLKGNRRNSGGNTDLPSIGQHPWRIAGGCLHHYISLLRIDNLVTLHRQGLPLPTVLAPKFQPLKCLFSSKLNQEFRPQIQAQHLVGRETWGPFQTHSTAPAGKSCLLQHSKS